MSDIGLLLAALHDLDPAFRRFSRSERVVHLIHSLGLQQPLPVQSMYIFKVCQTGSSQHPCAWTDMCPCGQIRSVHRVQAPGPCKSSILGC